MAVRPTILSSHNQMPVQTATIHPFDRLATHPVWGLVVLLAIQGVMLWITYNLALPAADWIQKTLVAGLGSYLSLLLANAPVWLRQVLVDGILRGVGTVISFIPVLLVFFAALSLLEESGYIARAERVTNRYLRRIGLPGTACVPLCMGFGCNTPAVLGCRSMPDRRSRLLTMMLVPLIPCTSRLAVIAVLAPAFFDHQAIWVTWGLISLNLVALAITSVVVTRLVKRQSTPIFTPSLPPYRIPNPGKVARTVWHNLAEFLSKAGTLAVFSIIIWALSAFPQGSIDRSYLARLGQAMVPLGQWMGINDWRLIVALLASFAAKENSLAVLGVLFPVTAGGLSLGAQVAAILPGAAALAFLAVQMLFVPCIATIVAIRQTSGSWKYALVEIGFTLALSLAGGTAIYWLARLI